MSLSLQKQQVGGPGNSNATISPREPASVLDYSKPEKANDNHPYLDVPLQNTFGRSSDTISDFSTYSADNGNERPSGGLLNVPAGNPLSSHSPVPPQGTWKGKIQASWTTNKGLALVILAQLFGTLSEPPKYRDI